MMEVDNSDTVAVGTAGGFDLEIFDESAETIEKYKCSVCGKVLKNAIQLIQLSVPTRTCLACFTTNVSKEVSRVLPLNGAHDATYYPDKFADKEIAQFKVFCSNKSNGCTWTGRLKYLEEHLSSCMYQKSHCNRCKQFVILNEHEDYCPEMPVPCSLCSKVMKRKRLKDHQTSCQIQVKNCDCGEKIALSEEPSKALRHWKHQKKCLFSYIGCEIDGTHENENHDALLVSKFVELKQQLITVIQSNEEKDIKIQQLENESIEMHTKISDFREQIDSLNLNLKDMSELMGSLQRELKTLNNQPSQPHFPIVGGGARLKKDVDEVKSKVADMENKRLEVNKTVTEMDLKIQLVENKTINGELIWKIDKLDFRMAQAKLGKVTALHSAPCYTKQYEYKYCTRLYLHGDGMGRGTHISIFLVVMKSDYDELLPWPMKKRVTFELINLENEASNVIEAFVSDPKSSSFQRPTKNMNVATGCPTFISIEQFLNGGFVKDNCAFIRTTVNDI